MVTEQQVDDVIQNRLASLETKPEYRMMYRWITAAHNHGGIYGHNNVHIYVGEIQDDLGGNLSRDFEPLVHENLAHIYKRVLVWQWDGRWEVVSGDSLSCLWS